MLITSEEFPPEVDEFKMANLTPEKSKLVRAPRIGESKVSIECRLYEHRKVYDMHMVLGQALLIRVKEGVADEEGRVNLDELKAIGRLSGKRYIKAFGDSLIEVE
jgi:flavin reductase (DIM6/NTAB) family NADH-FMN oxidoreductase RutF